MINMENVSIAKLKKQSVFTFPESSTLFYIYQRLIRPQIQASNHLSTHQKMSFVKPILLMKKDNRIFLTNNFEIFYLLKTANIDQALLSQIILTVQISEDQFFVDTVFYELIDIITRYQKILNIEAIYQDLNEFLTPELNQQLFEKNIFSIPTFCYLINIHEQTYYKRCKKGGSSVKTQL